jgi:hypothetical protein
MMDKATRAAHYRNKAEEVRIIAESMASAECKHFLGTVAGDYLMLAHLLERMQIIDPLPASE